LALSAGAPMAMTAASSSSPPSNDASSAVTGLDRGGGGCRCEPVGEREELLGAEAFPGPGHAGVGQPVRVEQERVAGLDAQRLLAVRRIFQHADQRSLRRRQVARRSVGPQEQGWRVPAGGEGDLDAATPGPSSQAMIRSVSVTSMVTVFGAPPPHPRVPS
jgi:hypothetical protein